MFVCIFFYVTFDLDSVEKPFSFKLCGNDPYICFQSLRNQFILISNSLVKKTLTSFLFSDITFAHFFRNNLSFFWLRNITGGVQLVPQHTNQYIFVTEKLCRRKIAGTFAESFAKRIKLRHAR